MFWNVSGAASNGFGDQVFTLKQIRNSFIVHTLYEPLLFSQLKFHMTTASVLCCTLHVHSFVAQLLEKLDIKWTWESTKLEPTKKQHQNMNPIRILITMLYYNGTNNPSSHVSLLHGSCGLQKNLQVLLPQCLRDHVCTPLRQIHVEWKPACYQLGASCLVPLPYLFIGF